ncbi:unnamed protein product [Arabidopsis halleri]
MLKRTTYLGSHCEPHNINSISPRPHIFLIACLAEKLKTPHILLYTCDSFAI